MYKRKVHHTLTDRSKFCCVKEPIHIVQGTSQVEDKVNGPLVKLKKAAAITYEKNC